MFLNNFLNIHLRYWQKLDFEAVPSTKLETLIKEIQKLCVCF